MMKTLHPALVAALLLCAVAPALGQRSLDKAETLAIIQKLTSDAPETWIDAGTITASHREYRAPQTTDEANIGAAIQEALEELDSAEGVAGPAEVATLVREALPFNVRYRMANQHTMYSDVVVRYDGDKFYWSIDVTSRADSVRPSADLAGNYMTDHFDLGWNGRRVFAWDGQEYTIYAASGNSAIVDAANRFPRAVNGPLTAGLVPWGQGTLTYANLSAADIAATEVSRDGITQIEITIDQADGASMTFVLDPARDYAVTSCTQPGGGDTVISGYYSGYRNVAGRWVPTTILVERHDTLTDRLLASDKWDITSIETAVPGPEQFKVEYEPDTNIEYFSPLSAKSSVFHYSNMADTRRLLAERLTYTATEGRQPQNCATAAVKYAATRLGIAASDSTLARMVDRQGQTTMADLRQSARRLGIHCRAVRTDIDTLKDLPACQAILHLPGKNHFVVLDRFDDQHVWLVDISDNRFLYRQDTSLLPLDWSAGIALLLSDRPIAGQFHDIDDSTLNSVVGGGESCTDLVQEEEWVACWYSMYDCGGYFQIYYNRWDCEWAPSGTCPRSIYYRYIEDMCLWNPWQDCHTNGDWITHYMWACD